MQMSPQFSSEAVRKQHVGTVDINKRVLKQNEMTLCVYALPWPTDGANRICNSPRWKEGDGQLSGRKVNAYATEYMLLATKPTVHT